LVGDQVYQKLKDSAEGPVIGKVISMAKEPVSGVSVCFVQLRNDPKSPVQNVLVRGNEWEVLDPAQLRAQFRSALQVTPQLTRSCVSRSSFSFVIIFI
jgi:hypothetical protein